MPRPTGSEACFRAEFPGDVVVQRERNFGYRDGNNLGIEMAISEGVDFVWMVRPDVRVARDCLERMVTLMERCPEIGICGPVAHADERAVLRWSLIETLCF